MNDVNPLLHPATLPAFDRILPEHVVPAVQAILADNRKAIAELLANPDNCSWATLVEPLDALDDRLNRAWSPVSHLNAVMNSEALREAYTQSLPLLSEYATEMGQNEPLFRAYQKLAARADYALLDAGQHRTVDNALRDFRLSGIDLPADRKQRYGEIASELSRLCSQFSDHVLDATQGWHHCIRDVEQLKGLPESALALGRQAAELAGEQGWVFNLEYPSYIAIMTYADDRALRHLFYKAHATRASDQGPNAGKWDNGPLMAQILALRQEEATLLGYASYAELSLATKMAESTDQVLAFLRDLAAKSRAVALADLEELRHYAREMHGLDNLEAWDMAYYSEKLRQHRFAFSEEEVRAYFPANHVVQGLFDVLNRLYGLQIHLRNDVQRWHPDVDFYDIRDAHGQLRGSFFLDLYARPKKRGGAWMDECTGRRRASGQIQYPVAYLVCNFTPPASDGPALLRHDEVVTLFHEFGHGLHHMLTQVDHAAVSGIRGVEWDAVELPSQFMENFCWDPEALALISSHHEDAEPLPRALLDKMLAARNFQSGLQMLRQLEFALFDFMIHCDAQTPSIERIYALLAEVREEVSVIMPPSFNRFPHSFSHIFSGGYAAGYYSYKWAEVLSSDAFSLFEEKGVFDEEVGRSFMLNVLEQGGQRDAMDSFVAFRGREPSLEPLLRHSGIAVEVAETV
ncbi:MAG: oligopeptidase [Pseudomonadota bacterium]